MFAQVVIDDEHIFAPVHKVLAHGAAGIGGDVLHRRLLRGCGGDHNGVFHGAVHLEIMDDLGHR